jgi:alpha-glucosidase
MYFQKIRHPANFRFAGAHAVGALHVGGEALGLRVRDLGEDVFHVELAQPGRWPLDPRLVRMHDDAFAGTSAHRLEIDASADWSLRGAGGAELLAGSAGAGFGVCGSAWLMQWRRTAQMRFYGQGQKVTGLEKSGRRTKFWNVDVWSDHTMDHVVDGQADPQYAAIPYLLVRNGTGWVGILVDHPGAVFMDTGSNWCFTGRDDQQQGDSFWFGADQGVPAFYLIAGTDPASVTRRLQRLVGTTPLPPLWALGHHQCRWGYAGTADLLRLDAAFRAHEFPCDGLWLDIDYMDRYKVFTTSPTHFGDRAAELRAVEANGRRVVPILDPGVKVEPGYEVAESGLAHGVFCLNPEGQPYVGFVWPGRTWFPDFSLPEARTWWAAHVAQFRDGGFHGAWIDMNDPSVGAAELDDMRFQRGAWEHWTYHNLYATGMAQATHEGFLQARPDERPFIVSRSAAAGSSRWTAVWTGDNHSNWHHLRTAIHATLNLALSGIPFNGPDVPGFGGHADRELAIAWYKAGFLFPFLRNHAVESAAAQEPWAFGPAALEVIRHVVRLRYKLLPYLYQLWVAQAERGEPVLRPLFLDFENADGLELDHVDDQFMVGPALMQAPLVRAGEQRRSVALPGTGRWFDACTGAFVRGGRSVSVTSSVRATPLYVREAQIVPMQPGERRSQHNDLAEIDVLVVLGAGCADEAVLRYVADDGASHAYRRGERSGFTMRARREHAVLHIAIDSISAAWRPVALRIVGCDGACEARITVPGGSFVQLLAPHRERFTGDELALAIGAVFTLAA